MSTPSSPSGVVVHDPRTDTLRTDERWELADGRELVLWLGRGCVRERESTERVEA